MGFATSPFLYTFLHIFDVFPIAIIKVFVLKVIDEINYLLTYLLTNFGTSFYLLVCLAAIVMQRLLELNNELNKQNSVILVIMIYYSSTA